MVPIQVCRQDPHGFLWIEMPLSPKWSPLPTSQDPHGFLWIEIRQKKKSSTWFWRQGPHGLCEL